MGELATDSLEIGIVLMSNKCPQCGAEYAADEDCCNRFNLCLAKEYEASSAYAAVHHLTVICYMLQHNAYSHKVWLEAREMLRQFIRQGITPVEVRKRTRNKLDSKRRKWSITKGARFSKFDGVAWTRTIADVRQENPEIYCADVRLWSRRVLADTEPVVQELKISSPASSKSRRGSGR